MKIKTGVNLHNRFDVVKNGEWAGYAENIILDQMYTRLVDFATYFVNIHFGAGSGTPTPDRTSLFAHLGTKTAVTSEIIRALPTSKWVRRIVLSPEEYVGQTITEVGIAFGSANTNLVTHAMIKDAEGNPLSLTKTDVDVVEIYATVFITLSTEHTNFNFHTVGSNRMLGYLTGHTNIQTSVVEVGASDRNLGGTVAMYLARNSVMRTKTTNSVTWSTRFGITQGNSNKKISEVGIENLCKFTTPNDILSSKELTNVPIGVGDGVTTKFYIRHEDVQNLVVKHDGVAVSGYTYHPGFSKENLHNYQDFLAKYPELVEFVWLGIGTSGDNSSGWEDATNITDGNCPTLILKRLGDASKIRYAFRVNSASGTGSTAYLRGIANNSPNMIAFYNSLIEAGAPPLGTISYVDLPVSFNSYEYIHLKAIISTNSSSSLGITMYLTHNDDNYIEYAVPPAEGVVITGDYNTPYYPKDESYVMDVSFTFQFGEGV